MRKFKLRNGITVIQDDDIGMGQTYDPETGCPTSFRIFDNPNNTEAGYYSGVWLSLRFGKKGGYPTGGIHGSAFDIVEEIFV